MFTHFLRRMSVRRRIVGSFLVLLIFLTLSIPLIITDHLSLTSRVDQLANVNSKSDRLLLSALANILSSRVNLMRYADDLTPSVSESLGNVSDAIKSIEEARALIDMPEQKTAMANILAGLVSYSTLITDVQTARVENRQQDVTTLLSNSYKLEFDLEQQIRAVANTNETTVNEKNKAALTVAQQRLILLVASYIGLLLLAILIAAVVQQSITRPVFELRQGAETFRQERHPTNIPSEGTDELSLLAQTFNQITAELSQTLAGLEQRVADRTKALATSAEVSHRLSTILERRKLVIEVVEEVKNAFNYYHAHIYLYDAGRDQLVMTGGTGEAGAAMLAEGHSIPKGRGLVGRAAETGKPVLVPDTSKDPNWLPNPLLPETKSEAAIPIAVGEKVLGVLDVQHNVVDGLKQEDVDLLQSISNQVAVALQNIQQYESAQKIASDLGVVANVGIATSTITDAATLLQEVVDLSKKSFDLYHAHIYLLNDAGDTLELASGAGEVGRQMVKEGRRIPLDSEKSLVARAARTREGVVVNDVAADPEFLPNPLLPNTRSEMTVPMIVAGGVIGVLDVQSDVIGRFTATDVNVQTTLASQVAIAVQNARSFTNAQRQAERETLLNVISQKIQGATTIESAMQIAARELGHALGMKPTLVALDPSALAGGNKGN